MQPTSDKAEATVAFMLIIISSSGYLQAYSDFFSFLISFCIF